MESERNDAQGGRPPPAPTGPAIAYVKPTRFQGAAAYAIHAEDGTELAVVVASREAAFAAVRQHDMEPVSVH